MASASLAAAASTEKDVSSSSGCCPPISWPDAPDDGVYTAKGEMVSLDGNLKAYFVGPNNVVDDGVEIPVANHYNNGIIFLSDVYGPNTSRSKGICDYFAAQRYFVLAPDCFRGETKRNQKGSFVKWLKKFSFHDVVKPDFLNSCEFLKAKGVNGSIGAIGFCWGAWAF